MTNRDVALLAFKLVGLWLMATVAIGIAEIPYMWETSPAEVRPMSALLVLLPVLVAAGIGVPVWLSADWFASRIFPDASPEATRIDRLRSAPLFALGLALMGVFMICEALPALVNTVSLLVQSRQVSHSFLGNDIVQERSLWSAAAKANMATAVTRLIIGLVFLVGPARLSTLFVRFRKEMAGSLETPDTAPGPSTTAAAAADRTAAPQESEGRE